MMSAAVLKLREKVQKHVDSADDKSNMAKWNTDC